MAKISQIQIDFLRQFYRLYIQKIAKKIKINLKIINLSNIVKLVGYYQIIITALGFIYNSKTYIKKIPFIKNKISSEKNKIIKGILDKFNKQTINLPKMIKLNEQPTTPEKIETHFKEMKEICESEYKNGKLSGAYYSNNDELNELMIKLVPYFSKSNPLHVNVYPAIRKMENECISILINLFNGDKNTCGTFTSGGTESILMACKTYRDMALKEKNIVNPEIIVSTTVHCAFNKACKYFNIKLVEIPCLDDGTFDILQLNKSINKNTILIVVSTPSYNLGIIDPVPIISDIAFEKNIPLHVDACIGSFLVNFLNLNYDFFLKGVTSISADFHKYGQSPKGASSILYRNKDIMKYQYYIDEKWSGGIYATSSFSGSRCGNKVALTWATLMFFGKEGYLNNFNIIIDLKNYFKIKIDEVKEVFVYGNPQSSIIALGSNKININILAEQLKKEGWDINVIQNPNGFHFCLTFYHTREVIDNFIETVKSKISILKNNTLNIKYSPCIYGTMQQINDSEIMSDVITDYLHVVNGVNMFNDLSLKHDVIEYDSKEDLSFRDKFIDSED